MFGFLRRKKISDLKMKVAKLERQAAPLHQCLAMLSAEGRPGCELACCLRSEIKDRELRINNLKSICQKMERT